MALLLPLIDDAPTTPVILAARIVNGMSIGLIEVQASKLITTLFCSAGRNNTDAYESLCGDVKENGLAKQVVILLQLL